MKHNYFLLTIAIALLSTIALASRASSAQSSGKALPDSVVNEDNIYKYLFTDRQKSELIMAEMRRRETNPEWELDFIEGDLYYNTGRTNEAISHYKNSLRNREISDNDSVRMLLLHRLISCYDMKHDETSKMRSIRLLMETAQRCGDKAMESIALFNLGKTIYHQGDKERAYDYMEQSINMMQATDYRLKYDNLRYEYKTLTLFYQSDQRSDDVLRTLDKWEEIVHKDINTDGAPEIDGLENSEAMDLLALRTVALQKLGRTAEAAKCYDTFSKYDKNLSRNASYLIMPYLFLTERYDEILRVNKSREQWLIDHGDTINYYMASVLKFLGRTYDLIGDYRNAASYFDRLATLRDSLKTREQESAALSYAALYDNNEKDRQLRQEAEESRTAWTIATFTSILLVLMIVFAITLFRKERAIRQLSMALVHQAEEHIANAKVIDAKTEENLRLRQQIAEATHSADNNNAAAEAQDNAFATDEEPQPIDNNADNAAQNGSDNGTRQPATADQPLTDTETEIISRIVNEIKQKHMYCNPDFSRTDILSLFPVGQNCFARLFRAYTGYSFTSYVQNLRLDYAAQLFIEHNDWTVNAVIKECGMSRTAFYKAFPAKFGMTPEEFRNSASKDA